MSGLNKYPIPKINIPFRIDLEYPYVLNNKFCQMVKVKSKGCLPLQLALIHLAVN